MSDTRKILHWIQDQEAAPQSGNYFDKKNPATGEKIAEVAQGNQQDAADAISAAHNAFSTWSALTPIARGAILRKAAQLLHDRKEDIGSQGALEG